MKHSPCREAAAVTLYGQRSVKDSFAKVACNNSKCMVLASLSTAQTVSGQA